MSKPLPPISRADRERVRKSLVNAYNTGHTTSGVVRVASLGFSSNPNSWHISANTVKGQPYQSFGAISHGAARADVHLTAILSADWLEKPLPDLIHRDEEHRQYDIIAGIHELTPPDDIARAELLVLSKTSEGGLRLTTQYGFRFTAGNLTAVTGLGLASYPSQAKLATRHAAKEFRKIVAAHVANRMLRKPKSERKYPTIDQWATAHALAIQRLDDITKAANAAADQLAAFRETMISITPAP